jgi:D-amino-acid oxidase
MIVKKFKFACITAMLAVIYSPILVLADAEIRKITPPKLDSAHLGKEILCHRPMRHGSPNMSVENKDNKVIAHNYGHGGSGWTLGPGSAGYVNNLLLNSKDATDLTKETPITIIGAGALGLFTAYDLEQKGFKNITIIAENFDSLTSHNAGGLLAPVSMDNDPQMQKTIDQIGIDAYNFYAAIAKKNHKDFKDGAVIVPTYFENRAESGLEPYVGKVMQPAKDVVLDFGNGTTRKMVSYDDGIFIDTAKMMIALNDYLKSKKIKFVQKKVKSFADLDGKFIINCSGLGSAELNHDSEMASVQGHLIMLKDQNPKDMQYMILVYFNEDKTKSGQKVKRSFYIFPKHLANTEANDVGVVGGTFIEGATANTPNKEEFDIMLQGAKKFYGIK